MDFRFILLTAAFYFCSIGEINATMIWTWDSGSTEHWSGYEDDTILTVESGRNGGFALGAMNAPPYEAALFPILEVGGQNIDLTTLMGTFGEYVPLTGEIYVDIKGEKISGHANYLDLWIFGESSSARFVTYPYDELGRIVDLGDGWFRYHMENLYHFENNYHSPESSAPGTIQMSWNWNFHASTEPVIFDNLTIKAFSVPEPSSLYLSLFGILLVLILRSTQRLTINN